MSRLWLVGMMGTGKSSAGRTAAERLGVGFADSDAMIERTQGRSIQAIWEEDGEAAFRELETRMIGDLARFHGVVSTGGGVVLAPSSRAMLAGKVVWLEASPETLASRGLGHGSERPLLEGADDVMGRLATLLEQREPLYAEVATHRIDTDHISIDEVANGIVGIWRE